MKRDWDMIRDILSKTEECTLNTDTVRLSDFPESDAASASYHVALLIDADLIDGQVVNTMGAGVKDFFAQRLTWEGHEFLDSIRSDTVWKKTKKLFADEGLSMTVDLIKGTAKKVGMAIIDAAS